MIDTAYAMGAAPGQGGAQGGGFAAFIPLIAIFAIFYFLLIRPQLVAVRRRVMSRRVRGRGERRLRREAVAACQ